MKRAICFLLCLSTVFATVELVGPGDKILLNDVSNYIGDAAPGQTVEFLFNRSTGGDGETRAIFWETATATTPAAEASTLQGGKLSLKVKIPEDAIGDFTFSVTLEGTELELIVAETKPITIIVRDNVYTVDYVKDREIDAGKTTQIEINVGGTSIASDTLMITSIEGIPAAWIKMDDLHVSYVGSREDPLSTTFNVTPFEEGYYKAKLTIGRASVGTADIIEMNFRVYPTLKSKLKAYSEGFSIIPIILQPFYSLLSWFGWV